MKQQYSDWFSGSAELNFVFLALAIIGIMLSLYLYLKSKRSKKPVYIQRHFPLIKDSVSAIEGLEIKYKKKRVNQLSLTKISFWNNGKKTIDKLDSAPTDKLRISVPEKSKIVNARVVYTRREANNITISLKENVAYISFDFLDFNDGAIFELHHTAVSYKDLSLEGTFKGAKDIKLGEYKDNYLFDKIIHLLFDWLPKNSSIFNYTFIMLMIPILFISALILFPAEGLASYFYKAPKVYKL